MEGGIQIRCRHIDGCALLAALRDETAEFGATFLEVADFTAVFAGMEEARGVQILVGQRQAEAVAEVSQIVVRQLLGLVRSIGALAGGAHAVALGGLRQDDRRLTAMAHCGSVGGVHLDRVMTAAHQRVDVLVRHVGDQRGEFGIARKEVFAVVMPVGGRELLELAVDGLGHALENPAFAVTGKQHIPVAAPQAFDDVPAGAGKQGLQLLHDVAVAANRAVEALQIAIDDQDQVVQLLARGQRDTGQRFRFVHFTVADKGPDLAVAGRHDLAMLQIMLEARLVNRSQQAQPHRPGRELPEIRHQRRVRIGRQTAADAPGYLAPKVLELIL